ncbi:MAG: AAA family ATPase [Verrucomicrobia bacterium]|nr:AAA family ATPase [Verrucomicrobiota bacterium]
MTERSLNFHRRIVAEVLKALSVPRSLIQIITGPRQVGKTTAALEIAAQYPAPHGFAAADSPLPPGGEWIDAQWLFARSKFQAHPQRPVLLVLDEVQKVRGWSESVKRLCWLKMPLEPIFSTIFQGLPLRSTTGGMGRPKWTSS